MLTSTGEATALLCTKADTMCLKIYLQTQLPLDHSHFRDFLHSSLMDKTVFARAYLTLDSPSSYSHALIETQEICSALSEGKLL